MMKKGLYIIVVAIGFLQVVGYLLKSKELKGIGMATASAPLPLVFTEVKGVETFANTFQLVHGKDRLDTLTLTPELYARFEGPYNRRNVYGAAFAYAPLLPPALRDQVFVYALCKANIGEAWHVEPNVSGMELRIQTKTRGRQDLWIYPITCP